MWEFFLSIVHSIQLLGGILLILYAFVYDKRWYVCVMAVLFLLTTHAVVTIINTFGAV